MLALRTHLSPGLCLHVRQPIASRLGVVPVVLAGKTGVGKTALLLRICENKFSATVPTTGVESGVITVAVPGGLVKSRIWDTGMHRRGGVRSAGATALTQCFALPSTAGQERYRAITVTYYRGTGGAMLVYDITDPTTFTGVEELIPTIRQHAGDACVFLLVGNKSDLEHIRAVPVSDWCMSLRALDCSRPVHVVCVCGCVLCVLLWLRAVAACCGCVLCVAVAVHARMRIRRALDWRWQKSMTWRSWRRQLARGRRSTKQSKN